MSEKKSKDYKNSPTKQCNLLPLSIYSIKTITAYLYNYILGGEETH
jgi:hypothetical protein